MSMKGNNEADNRKFGPLYNATTVSRQTFISLM